MAPCEQLKHWREYVGYKSKNMNEKRETSSYKVRKCSRLKSFMEDITKKQKKRVQTVAKKLGIETKYRQVNEVVSSEEEQNFHKLKAIVSEQNHRNRARKRELKKQKRLEEEGV